VARQKIDSLTSLRFFAAAAIVGSHARGHFGFSTNLLAPFELSQGVALFFVLSGFILTFVYPDLNRQGAVRKFWLARFARVWPLHLTTFLLYLALLPEFCHDSPAQALTNLALVQAWVPIQNWFFSFNSVSWSISTEAFFYLLFPLLIRNFEKEWPQKLTMSFAMVLLMVAISNNFHYPIFADDKVSIHGLMYVNPVSRLFEFVLGMTVALFYRKYLANLKLPAARAFVFEVAALLSVYLLTFNTVRIAHYLARFPAVGEGGRMWLEHGGVPVLAFASLIAVMAWGRGPVARILSFKPLVFLGEISFASYLLHRMFLHYYWNHFAPEHGAWPFAIYVAMLLAASYVCWALVEVPCRQAIVQGLKALPKPSMSASFALFALFAAGIAIWSGSPLTRLNAVAVNDEMTKMASAESTVSGRDGAVIGPVISPVISPVNGPGTAGSESRPSSKNNAVFWQKGKVAFGDDLLLLGTKAVAQKDAIKVTLYWQALRDQKIGSFIAVKLLSENNVLVRLKDFRQSLREERVKTGECFSNEIVIPANEMQYVHSMAFGLTNPIGKGPVVKVLDGDARCPLSLYDGMVAVQLGPRSLAAKSSKPIL